MTKHHLNIGAGGNVWLQDKILIVRYPEGDYDIVNRKMGGFIDHLHRALYDEYQCSEVLKDGDEFILAGKVVFRCESVHVVKVGG